MMATATATRNSAIGSGEQRRSLASSSQATSGLAQLQQRGMLAQMCAARAARSPCFRPCAVLMLLSIPWCAEVAWQQASHVAAVAAVALRDALVQRVQRVADHVATWLFFLFLSRARVSTNHPLLLCVRSKILVSFYPQENQKRHTHSFTRVSVNRFTISSFVRARPHTRHRL